MRALLIVGMFIFSCVFLMSCGSEKKEKPIPQTPKPETPQKPEKPEAPEGSPVEKWGKLRVEGNKIVSESGEPVQLKGMSLFWSQWSGDFWNTEAIKNTPGSVVRAAMGVEMGGYLANKQEEMRVRTVIDASIDRGIYVIVDWHDHNAHAHTREAVDFFSRIAKDYGDKPNVLFELYNEPVYSSWGEVKGYAEKVTDAIREHSDNIVIVGSPSWSQRVDLAADDPLDQTNVAYSIHFYAATHKKWLRDKGDYAMAKGIALFATEWGVCDASGNGAIDLAESDRWIAWMDEHKISWANWSLFDKPESASALRPGASKTGPWSEKELTTSGKYIFSKIAK